ncbi:MAG: class I SAM-dependent methyltransferase [Pseudomonadota bacterium]
MQDDGYFGEDIAAAYDDDAHMFDPKVVDPAVDILAELAGEGRALEFAIGTGRIALPLAARGVPVAGIDLSKAMVERLQAKPGGADLDVIIGDFASARVEGSFSLVYLVFNTITNLTSQAAQTACFENAAAHLEPGGRFVIEVAVPPLQLLPLGETKRVYRLEETYWGVDEFDVVTQAFTSHKMRSVNGRTVRRSLPLRYVWPAELDLMATFAGMTLEERWSGWRREPFTHVSLSHVSIWRKWRGHFMDSDRHSPD